MSLRLGVLASGEGSNFSAIQRAVSEGRVPAELALLISDREQAPVLDRAQRAGVEHRFIAYDRNDRQAFEREAAGEFQDREVRLVVMAGFMRLVTPCLIGAFEGRLLNIHPSLLPAFKGLHAVRQALEYGVKVTGCSVHLVTEDLDAGPILGQRAVDVLPGDDEASLSRRIHEAEHALYPEVIRDFIQQHLRN